MPIRAVVFDAYGTLFDVAGAARAAAAEPGGAALATLWPRLAEDWRRKQLEYTWLRAVMREHADFAAVTADALDWALAAAGLAETSQAETRQAEAALRARLLALYDELPAYPEVPAMLARLKAAGLPAAILSNGTPAMLAAAVASAGIGDDLAAVLSVEDVGVFKPDHRVYALATAHLGLRPDEVMFVSSNGWDVAGAAGFGFAAVWVNRAGLPMDRLSHGPRLQLSDLSTIPDLAPTL